MTDPIIYLSLALSTLALIIALSVNKQAYRVIVLVFSILATVGYAGVIAYVLGESLTVVMPQALNQLSLAVSAMPVPDQLRAMEVLAFAIIICGAAIVLMFGLIPGKEAKEQTTP